MPQATYPRAERAAPVALLFGLAPSGVYPATSSYLLCGALLPHLFTLAGTRFVRRRSVFCGTIHRLISIQIFTSQALPGTPLYGARTFLCIQKTQRLSGRLPPAMIRYSTNERYSLFFLTPVISATTSAALRGGSSRANISTIR